MDPTEKYYMYLENHLCLSNKYRYLLKIKRIQPIKLKYIFYDLDVTKTTIFHLLKSFGRFIVKTALSFGCLVDVILHVSSSTQQDLVIFMTQISDSDTIIKNGFLKAKNNTNY